MYIDIMRVQSVELRPLIGTKSERIFERLDDGALLAFETAFLADVVILHEGRPFLEERLNLGCRKSGRDHPHDQHGHQDGKDDQPHGLLLRTRCRERQYEKDRAGQNQTAPGAAREAEQYAEQQNDHERYDR